MPKCPNCNFVFKSKAKLCIGNIASTLSKKIKKRYHRYAEQLKYFLKTKLTNDCFSTSDIINFFSTSDIINFYGLKNKTEGDVFRLICDSFVCNGVLTKVKFSTKGHIYQKNYLITECPNCVINDKGLFCTFNWKNAKEVDVDGVE